MSDTFDIYREEAALILFIDRENIRQILSRCDDQRKIEIRNKIQNFVYLVNGREAIVGTTLRNRAERLIEAIDSTITAERSPGAGE